MDTSQLGFHNLPFLAHRKSVKKGFEFTLMVVGKRVYRLGVAELPVRAVINDCGVSEAYSL